MAEDLSSLGLADVGEVLHTLLDHSPDVVVITDAGGIILFRNRSVSSNHHVIGTSGFAYVAHDDRARVEALCRKVVDTGRADTYDVRAPRPGGRFVVYRTRVAPICRDGSTVALLFIATDVTAHLEAERHLVERDRHLRQAQRMEATAQLVSGMAHNFNNLLTAVLTNLERAERLATDEARTPVVSARAAAVRAAGLVNDLLVFAGNRPPEGRRRLDLRQAVEHAVHLFRGTVDGSIEIELDLAAGLPSLEITDQLEQVVLNLLLNARDALAGSGRGRPRIRVELGPGRSPGRARLRVTDNGSGMAAPVRERAFEPFFTTKPPGRGTGLGLSTAYRIVAEHGGSIALESEPGAGTTVSVELPVPEASAGAAVEAAGPDRADGPAPPCPTVLLIDDEPLVRRALADVLRDSGYQVLEAADGADGLARFLDHQADIDLVLVDQTMPTMSGSELLARIRRLAPAIKAVLITGYAADPSAAELVQAVLPKPIDAGELVACVEQVLSGDRGGRASG